MLTNQNTVAIRDIQRHSEKVLKKIKASRKPTILIARNKPQIALVNLDYLEELEAAKETADIMKDPEEVAAIRKGIEQIKNGEVVPFIPQE